MSNKVNNHIIVESLPNDIEFGGSYIIAQANPNTYTHSFFKYPCRFIPEIPRWAIQKYLTGVESASVFDPFAGSGTTLLESVINDYEAYGTEIDPSST
jgi:DNA modification methylase